VYENLLARVAERQKERARLRRPDPPPQRYLAPASSTAWPPREWWLERIPKTANQMLRSHWASQRREVTAWAIALRKVEWPHGPWHPDRRGHRNDGGLYLPAKVHLHILVLRRRLQDPDNAVASVKPLLDALKREGWLVDDSPRWLLLEVEERAAAAKRTIVKWRIAP
jgi:hypothetical protein